MNPASASSPLSFVLVQEPAKISSIDLSHKHKNFIYSVQFQTRTLVLCTRMENWKYFFVSSFVLLSCLRDAKSEKSDNEIDKTKWTPKLRDPVKVKYFIKSVPASFSSKCRIAVWNCKQNHSFTAHSPSGTFQEQSKIVMLLHAWLHQRTTDFLLLQLWRKKEMSW